MPDPLKFILAVALILGLGPVAASLVASAATLVMLVLAVTEGAKSRG